VAGVQRGGEDVSEVDSWLVDVSDTHDPVTVEVVSGAGGRSLSIETPEWSLDFCLPNSGLIHAFNFLLIHAGKAEFAECEIGSFYGRAVRIVNDNEYDRIWLRIGSAGQLADFPLIGERAQSFVNAVAEVAECELKYEHGHWRTPASGYKRITHLPSGVSVSRCYADTTVRNVQMQLIAELSQKSQIIFQQGSPGCRFGYRGRQT